jgi:hypothetical protein
MIPIEIQAAGVQSHVNYGQNIGGMVGNGTSVGNGTGGSVAVGNQATYDPWSQFRDDAGEKLAKDGFGVNNDPSNFYRSKLQAMSEGQFTPNDPSYQWRFEQGQQATERSLAAKGLLNSGNAAIELQNYGQQAASQEYGAQFDRMLKGLAGVSAQYDTQQQRLMQMAGINLDPTSATRLGIMAQEADTNRMSVNNQIPIAKIGASASQANAASNSMLQSYQMARNDAGNDALSSSLWFNRDGGLSDRGSSMMWGVNGSNY